MPHCLHTTEGKVFRFFHFRCGDFILIVLLFQLVKFPDVSTVDIVSLKSSTVVQTNKSRAEKRNEQAKS
jgi:hypothetical protein